MSLMMTVSQMTREGHHGQVGGRAPATLAVNRGLFLGAPRPVEGHRRQWPSIISYPAIDRGYGQRECQRKCQTHSVRQHTRYTFV